MVTKPNGKGRAGSASRKPGIRNRCASGVGIELVRNQGGSVCAIGQKHSDSKRADRQCSPSSSEQLGWIFRETIQNAYELSVNRRAGLQIRSRKVEVGGYERAMSRLRRPIRDCASVHTEMIGAGDRLRNGKISISPLPARK